MLWSFPSDSPNFDSAVVRRVFYSSSCFSRDFFSSEFSEAAFDRLASRSLIFFSKSAFEVAISSFSWESSPETWEVFFWKNSSKVSQVTVKDLEAMLTQKKLMKAKGVVPGCCKHANPALGGYSVQLFSYKVEVFLRSKISSSPRLLWTCNPALRGYSVEKFSTVVIDARL